MNNKHAERVPFPIQIMNFIGVLAIILGFFLIFQAIRTITLDMLIDNPGKLDGLETAEKLNLKNAYISAQFAGSLIGLIILPLLYILCLRDDLKFVFKIRKGRLLPLIALSTIIFFCFLPLVNAVNEWNQSLHLPAPMKDLELSFKNMEDQVKKILDLIIYYDNFSQFLVIFFLIAILPALGEELLFRGIVQNQLMQIFRNPHAAIIIASFLFSFIHFQFFGFFPRMLLGLLFGYLYYWSGNILIPVCLHCLNNGLTLINMNLLKDKQTEIDLSSAQNISLSAIIFSLVLSVVLLYIYRQVSLRIQKEDERMAENIQQ
jgi:uncharacterized protein